MAEEGKRPQPRVPDAPREEVAGLLHRHVGRARRGFRNQLVRYVIVTAEPLRRRVGGGRRRRAATLSAAT